MHPTITTILIRITRAPAPMIARAIARIHHHDRNGTSAPDTSIISVETRGRKLVTGTAGGAAVGGAPAAVELALEELLVHGAVVDAGAGGPLPGGGAAVAGGAHPAVVLWFTLSAIRGLCVNV